MILWSSGPLNVFRWFRMTAGADKDVINPGGVAELLNCHWCQSLYVSLIVLTTGDYHGLHDYLIQSFGASFLAGMLIELTRRYEM